MSDILLWIGLTCVVALPVFGIPYIAIVGAILMIVGCVLRVMGR